MAFLMPTLQAQWNIGVLEESSLGGARARACVLLLAGNRCESHTARSPSPGLTFFGMMIGAAFWGVIGDKLRSRRTRIPCRSLTFLSLRQIRPADRHAGRHRHHRRLWPGQRILAEHMGSHGAPDRPQETPTHCGDLC